MRPQLSVIIAAFDRIRTLGTTLRSVQQAAAGLSVEILLVDAGSIVPLVERLVDLPLPVRHLRQASQGLIAARLTGLAAAAGEYVIFLDGDDLVHPAKFKMLLEALQQTGADLAYDDTAAAVLEVSGRAFVFRPSATLARASDPAEFFLRVQPLPHGPLYRRKYVEHHLALPIIPVDPSFDAAGDVWTYYNLCPFPAKIVKVDAALTATTADYRRARGIPGWERIGLAALRIMEAFAARCPSNPTTSGARTVAGECAFDSWRRLPRGFNADFAERTVRLWRKAPHGSLTRLGGTYFQSLARAFGPERAARVMRLRNANYAEVRTLSETDYKRLFAES